MNNLDKQYLELCQDILVHNGIRKGDRTGTGTISVFGRQIRHKMSEGFPLLTTKKMYFKGIVTELIWFLRGDTNIKYLVDNDCHIWDGDAYKRYRDALPNAEKSFRYEGSTIETRRMTKDEFIDRIKTDDEFAKKWGDLGPIYGKQWRDWEDATQMNTTIDQIATLILDLKTNPDSRRLLVTAWNPSDLSNQVLPPCHYGFQVYTRELNLEERKKLCKVDPETECRNDSEIEIYLGLQNIPTRAISLMWNQRSVDVPLGLPFNIASYGLLLEILAKTVNMVPDELIGNLGDAHIYVNQIDGIIEQLSRENKFSLPRLQLNPIFCANLEHKGFDAAIYGQINFGLENYQSHPALPMPLSN